MNKPLIVATMTSWKGRILTLSKMIEDFFVKQTKNIDIFYLWLSCDEFQNKEFDLPKNLISIIQKYNIKLKWLSGNEYCYKRWYVYPQHYNDYVISLDDDCFYSPSIIEDSLNIVNNFKNTVCGLWWQFTTIPTYNNDIKIDWKYDLSHFSIKHWFTANSMIPPGIFPLEALNADIIEYRRIYATKHDEAWLIPYFLKNNTNIAFVPKNYPFITVENSQCVGLSHTINNKKIGLYTQTELALYYMLKKTGMLEKYKQIHKGYNYDRVEQTL